MDEGGGGGGGGVSLGGISYGVGVDLDKLQADLAKAEQLISQHVARAQQALGSIPVGSAGRGGARGGGGGAAGSAPAMQEADAKGLDDYGTRAAKAIQTGNAAISGVLQAQRTELSLLILAENRLNATLLGAGLAKLPDLEGATNDAVRAIQAKNAALTQIGVSQQTALTGIAATERIATQRVTTTAGAAAGTPSGRATRAAGAINANDLPPAIRERVRAAAAATTAAAAGDGEEDAEGEDEEDAKAAAKRIRKARDKAVARQLAADRAQEERNLRVEAGLTRRVEARGETEPADEATGPTPADEGRLYSARGRQSTLMRRLMQQRAQAQVRADQEAVAFETRVARRQQRPFSSLTTGRTYNEENLPEREGPEPAAPAAEEAPRRPRRTGPTSVAGLFDLTGPNVLRATGALFGIGFGINIAAGIAREIHNLVVSTVGQEETRQVAVRQVAATYGGGAARGFETAAQQFIQTPTTVGSQQQFLQAAAGFAPLQQQYGLTTDQVKALTTASGELARVQGTDLPTASHALLAVMQGNTDAARELGLNLTDEYGRLRSVGVGFEELVHATSRARAEQILYRDVMAGLATEQQNAATQTDSFAQKVEQLGRSWERFRSAVGKAGAGPASGIVDFATGLLGGPTNPIEKRQAEDLRLERIGAAENPLRGLPFGLGGEPYYDIQEKNAKGQRTFKPLDEATVNERMHEATERQAQAAEDNRAFASQQIQVADATEKAKQALDEEALGFARLSSNLGVALQRLEQLNTLRGQYQQIGTALRGPDFPYNVSAEQYQGIGMVGAAGDTAAQEAQRKSQAVAEQAATELRQRLSDAITNATSPEATAQAQQNLAEFDRRAAGHTAEARAQAAQAIVGRARTDIQDSIAEIQLRASDRQLAVQNQLNAVTEQRLLTERSIATVQLDQADTADRISVIQNRIADKEDQLTVIRNREANVGDQITVIRNREADVQARIEVASRNNLDTQQKIVQAQQAALGPENQLSDVQYGVAEAKAQINARFSNLARGIKPEPGAPPVGALVRQIVSGTLAEPQADLDAMRARRRVELAQRTETAEGLQRQANLLPLEAQERGLQDQRLPLEAQQRGIAESRLPIERQIRDITEGRLIPLQQEQRALQEQLIPLEARRRGEEAVTAEVERRVQLANLGDQPALTALQQTGNRVEQARIDADRAYRAAQDQIAGRDPRRDTAAEAIQRANDLRQSPRIPGSSDQAQGAVQQAIGNVEGGYFQVGQITIQVQELTDLSPDAIGAEVVRRLLRGSTQSKGLAPAGTAGTR